MASLAVVILHVPMAHADFQWLQPWQPVTTISQSQSGTMATATFGDLNASTTTASVFATEDGHNVGNPDVLNASATIAFSRMFRLSGDSTPTAVTLTGAAVGTFAFPVPSPPAHGNGTGFVNLGMAITGQGPSPLFAFGVMAPAAAPFNDSRSGTLMLSDGVYTVTGQIDVAAGKTSGLTPVTADFSTAGGGGFTFGVTTVPEPGSSLLLAIGAVLGRAGCLRRRRREQPLD